MGTSQRPRGLGAIWFQPESRARERTHITIQSVSSGGDTCHDTMPAGRTRSENAPAPPCLTLPPAGQVRPIILGRAVCFSEPPVQCEPRPGAPEHAAAATWAPHGPVKRTRENKHPGANRLSVSPAARSAPSTELPNPALCSGLRQETGCPLVTSRGDRDSKSREVRILGDPAENVTVGKPPRGGGRTHSQGRGALDGETDSKRSLTETRAMRPGA